MSLRQKGVPIAVGLCVGPIIVLRGGPSRALWAVDRDGPASFFVAGEHRLGPDSAGRRS
jgi:hypothetical protein